MIRTRLGTSALLLCLCANSMAGADALQFTIDSTRSYLTLAIPNFTDAPSGLSVNMTGQNRTNGARISTAWSASTNTGNTAFVSGTLSTTVGGSLTGKTLSAIQFISGATTWPRSIRATIVRIQRPTTGPLRPTTTMAPLRLTTG